MKSIFRFLTIAVPTLAVVCASPAAPPDFTDTAQPAGWSVTRGTPGTDGVLRSPGGAALDLKTSEAITLPVEVTFRFRAAAGDGFTVAVMPDGADNKAKPLLQARFARAAGNQATLQATADGEPMAADIVSTRTWSRLDVPRNTVTYKWRFSRVGNLWDENDRSEIGASYAQLAPFDEKVFTVRLVLRADARQIWLDDRFVAEIKKETPASAQFVLQLAGGTRVLSAKFKKPLDHGLFHALSLSSYSHEKTAAANAANEYQVQSLRAGKQSVPVLTSTVVERVDIDLGESLYRYRNTKGTGPDAPYVNALRTWPGAFEVDPARIAFRVPHRAYQNAWLLAWKDGEANAVAKGAFRFYREDGGYPASTDFEISEAAIKQGLVTTLSRKTADGKQLYLIKVPIDTDAFYGTLDLRGQPIDFEITKPLQLTRSYPDPIYYGYHPGGPPSSIHVAGITLEEAPFSFEVRPAQFGHVFEQPERPEYSVAVTNNTAQPLQARVAMTTRSHDNTEANKANASSTIAPGQTGEVKLNFDLRRNGWHELKTTVQAGGAERRVTLSLLNLPRNTRAYGNASNETRFGTWNLWGHYTPLMAGPVAANEPILAMLRKLGLRRIDRHTAFLDAATMKKHDFLPGGPHTLVSVYHRLNENDSEAMKKMVADELAQVDTLSKEFDEVPYYYGGEWHIGEGVQYGQWPAYTGEGDRDLSEDEKARIVRQTKIFKAIGEAMREKYPNTKLYLQWGAPKGTIAFLRNGFPKELVDGFGMDAPMFELLPELSNVPGSINDLWTVRQEAKKFGWPQLPIAWVEGPFFPTNPGALTEQSQADYQARYLLAGMAYGIEQFEAGVVPFDAGNYYGAEHYGAGTFHRIPLMNPKPAAAVIATMSTLLHGSDPIGSVETGVPTTYCLGFENTQTKARTYALWRVEGNVNATVRVRGANATITDSMGNATKLPVQNGAVRFAISSSPVWLTGVEEITGFTFDAPQYSDAPAPVSRVLSEMSAANWRYDGNADELYQTNHFATKRVTTPNLKAAFNQGEAGYPDAVAITLDKESNDRPLATRYGVLHANRPIPISGKASALGLWIKGNAGWGRVVYQLKDAKGEVWTSNGTRDDWNADDTHAWSYVDFEGWRYVRFPLPGSLPYDAARTLETTWWGSRDGDGIVDLPLSVEKIFVEARNEVPYLGEMRTVPDRTYKLSRLTAEYEKATDATQEIIAQHRLRKLVPSWSGPQENIIAHLQAEGAGEAPVIREFTEPGHFNDGRRMTIHFNQEAGKTYRLYVARYADGRGAELLRANVTDQMIVTGFRPETEMFLFMTSVGADKKESKPSAPYRLITHDNFREK